MQRVHIVSAAAAIAVVALLLVGRGSNTSWVAVEESPASVANGDSRRETDSPQPPSGAAARARRPGEHASSGRARETGADERNLGTVAGKPFARRDALAIRGQPGSGDVGVLGEAAGRRSRGAVGPGSAALGAPELGRGASALNRDRPNVAEFLADPANRRGGVGGEEEVGGEENTDVVLSVPLNRETGVVAADATAPIAEQDLEFADDGVRFEPESVLAFPDAGNIRGDAGTLQLDVQPEWNGGEEGDFSLVNVRTPNDPRNLLRLFKNGRYLRFMFADNTGVERDISATIDDWDAGEIRTITATWGEGRTALYLNGRLVGQNNYDGPLEIHAGTPLYLGSDVPEAGAKGARGVISNFQVFGRALQGAEIASR